MVGREVWEKGIQWGRRSWGQQFRVDPGCTRVHAIFASVCIAIPANLLHLLHVFRCSGSYGLHERGIQIAGRMQSQPQLHPFLSQTACPGHPIDKLSQGKSNKEEAKKSMSHSDPTGVGVVVDLQAIFLPASSP